MRTSDIKMAAFPETKDYVHQYGPNFNSSRVEVTELERIKKIDYILYDKEMFRRRRDYLFTYCILSVILSFLLGLFIGVIIVKNNIRHVDVNSNKVNLKLVSKNSTVHRNFNSVDEERFTKVSFKVNDKIKDVYPKSLTKEMKEMLKDRKENKVSIVDKYVPNELTVLYDNIYWGPEVENSMPQGYGNDMTDIWEEYIDDAEVVKMEVGCGRMQNRLVTFKDGLQACVRYRQNTDQIQGEIFSFYVGRLLNLTNLAPSVVKVVDTKEKLWNNVVGDIGSAQWNSNRAVVITQYIPSLESASIPDIFKPTNRHLNKYDIYNILLKENDTVVTKSLLDKMKPHIKEAKKSTENFSHIDMKLSKQIIKLFLELAQWSDLIIFDYLTANLDRIVNNLFNYQWNVNIMDGPAHNLARKMDSGLLLFLDNESGLLHGYRLLKKYNIYHSLMLDNLCVFRKRTVDALKFLYNSQSVGTKLLDVFHKKNDAVIRDILPPLPEKNAKILHDRIGRVLNQIEKCDESFR
ncbi:hypothetical protein K1T71_000873 [Dendrolimus kikuchii]|uniref:Uncharacterized protein n=1 Tax=Dendrolimus kikuchii TaxID=765133 RepID=A0ACC1DG89_9NEOP|nr:hypothetical protein K1T71_000873 [Dendrolimus kikuchii]